MNLPIGRVLQRQSRRRRRLPKQTGSNARRPGRPGRSSQETLITAQSLAEDLKKTALRESELLISDAEVKAEKVLDAAHRRVAKLSEDIREMKVLPARVGTAVRTIIETHLALLESLAAEETGDPVLEGRAVLRRS